MGMFFHVAWYINLELQSISIVSTGGICKGKR